MTFKTLVALVTVAGTLVDVMLPEMDSVTSQAFVMASVTEFCSLWAAGMDAVLRLESVRGQATLCLEARLGSPGVGPPPLFPSASFPPHTPGPCNQGQRRN